MKLQEYIEKKEKELVAEGMRSAKIRRYFDCEISRTSVSFTLCVTTKPALDAEIKEINKKALSSDLVPAVSVDFDVVKPRCRKPETLSFYVQTI